MNFKLIKDLYFNQEDDEMENLYDIVIIGGGPAGLAAGIYGARAKMKTLILEKTKNGGQIVITHEVANYPGSVENASGHL